MTISKSVDGIGTSGVTTTQLSAKVYTSNTISSNATVKISYSDWTFPTYYVDTATFDGTSYSFTAYDRCKDLDIPFDDTDYPETKTTTTTDDSGNTTSTESEASYLLELIVAAAANQAGFETCNYTPSGIYVKYADYSGKTCREIIEMATEISGGVVYCNSDDELSFCGFEGGTTGGSVSYGEYENIVEQPEKSYTALIFEGVDDIVHKESTTYTYGSGGYNNTLILSGSLVDGEAAQAIATRMFVNSSFDYMAFTVTNAAISSNISVLGEVLVYTSDTAHNTYICRDITITFTATGAVADISSPQRNESKAEYINKTQREINTTVKTDKTYGVNFVNKNGAGYSYDA